MSNDLILRAWDKKSRKMREVDSIAFHNLKSVCDYNNSRLPKIANLWGYNIIADKDIIINRDIKDVELMHYTGHDDINGVRIFANDIVKTPDSDIGIVVYKKHFLEWRIVFIKGRKHLTKMKEYGVAMFDFTYPKMHLEIIGNIYENKELLKRESA